MNRSSKGSVFATPLIRNEELADAKGTKAQRELKEEGRRKKEKNIVIVILIEEGVSALIFDISPC